MNAGIKWVFDTVISGVLLFVLSPLLLALAVLVKLDSSGPVLFRQPRLGKSARLFEILKFRTMVVHPENGPSVTGRSDPRVTRIGRILRRYDLDELPTLFNVFKGEMSFVGPRPEVPKFLPYYTDEQRRVFAVRPGLTDLATLAFRHEAVSLSGQDLEQTYVREILPRKLALNLQYIRGQNFFCDLGIIFRTLTTILSQPKG
jgi:lipopolysaccharide/colanic/teichoic acid biosynthesis glycosyltransferase